MASMLKKVIDYVGLSPDDHYDAPGMLPLAEPVVDDQPTIVTAEPRVASAVQAIRPASSTGNVRPVPAVSAEPSKRTSSPTVRPIAAAVGAKPAVVEPSNFGDAQRVADEYKSNLPVMMDLREVDRDLSRRLIDFASGMCYGLGGKMERIEHQLFLIIPDGVEVLEEDRRPLLNDQS